MNEIDDGHASSKSVKGESERERLISLLRRTMEGAKKEGRQEPTKAKLKRRDRLIETEGERLSLFLSQTHNNGSKL